MSIKEESIKYRHLSDILSIIKDLDYQVIDQRTVNKKDIIFLIMSNVHMGEDYVVIYMDFHYVAVPFFIDSKNLARIPLNGVNTVIESILSGNRSEYTVAIPKKNIGDHYIKNCLSVLYSKEYF